MKLSRIAAAATVVAVAFSGLIASPAQAAAAKVRVTEVKSKRVRTFALPVYKRSNCR